MTAEEEEAIRAAIRCALKHGDWKKDIGFIVAEEAHMKEGDVIPPFEVLIDPSGLACVTIPAAWEHLPHMSQTLQSMTTHELRVHLGSHPKLTQH